MLFDTLFKIPDHLQVRSVLQNGVGRYVPQLARFSLFFCQRKPDSSHVREYIRRDLADFALTNPCTLPSSTHTLSSNARFQARQCT